MAVPVLSIVTLCFDRWDHLRQSLPTWRALPGAPPIFVGTHDDEEIPDWLNGVHLVRVRADGFHRTRLRNCTARAARTVAGPDYLLFMDSDIRVLDNRVFHRALQEGDDDPDYVLDSPWALAEELLLMSPMDPERKEPGKRGTHLVRTRLFFDVGGFDQRFVGWGVEDRNLYGRYAQLSDRVAYYDRAGIQHIDHSDSLREQHNPGGVPRVSSMLGNLRRHMEVVDVRGDSWRDDFGYPEYSVSWIPSSMRSVIEEEDFDASEHAGADVASVRAAAARSASS